MPWEVNWSDYIEEDFLEYKFTNNEIIATRRKVELALEFPARLKKVQNLSNEYDIRDVRYRDFRIYVWLKHLTENAYCLRMFSRNKSYEKKEKNKILTVIQKINSK